MFAGMTIAEAEAMIAAAKQDLAARREAYPGMVAKLRIKQQEADYVIGLLDEITGDLAVAFNPSTGWFAPDAVPPPRYSWRQKVTWINGELDRREREFPERVAKARMTQAEAAKGLELMRALRRLYFLNMFAWTPEHPKAIAYLDELRATTPNLADYAARVEALRASEGCRLFQEEARAHVEAVTPELYPQPSLAA